MALPLAMLQQVMETYPILGVFGFMQIQMVLLRADEFFALMRIPTFKRIACVR
jgi:hypothetical protein